MFLCVFGLIQTACLSPEESNVDSNTLRPNINTNFDSNATNANANKAEDDEAELDKLVNLSFVPEENVWRKDIVGGQADSNRAPGPSDYKLTAVLRFSEKDTKSLVAKVSAAKPPFDAEIEVETWFPAELIAQGDTTGNSKIKGKGYSADDFLKPPYSQGSLIRIKRN